VPVREATKPLGVGPAVAVVDVIARAGISKAETAITMALLRQ
jgi:hypothetical protein